MSKSNIFKRHPIYTRLLYLLVVGFIYVIIKAFYPTWIGGYFTGCGIMASFNILSSYLKD